MYTREIAVLLLITIASFLPTMCVIKMQMIKKFKNNAIITKAAINKAQKRTGYKGAVYYMLLIQYKDHAGNIFTGRAIGANKNVTGTTITIMYKTTDPANFKADFGKRLPWVPGFSLVLFAMFLWLSYTLLN